MLLTLYITLLLTDLPPDSVDRVTSKFQEKEYCLSSLLLSRPSSSASLQKARSRRSGELVCLWHNVVVQKKIIKKVKKFKFLSVYYTSVQNNQWNFHSGVHKGVGTCTLKCFCHRFLKKDPFLFLFSKYFFRIHV